MTRRMKSLRPRGFTLMEAMLALVTLTIIGVGAGVGLQSLAKVSSGVEDRLWISSQLISEVEQLRGTPYASLVSGSTTSDADRDGKTYPINYAVREIDPNNPTNTLAGSGLKEVTVTITLSSSPLTTRSVVTWLYQ
jgi:Tfp pilus assembly protein PilV